MVTPTGTATSPPAAQARPRPSGEPPSTRLPSGPVPTVLGRGHVRTFRPGPLPAPSAGRFPAELRSAGGGR